MRWWWSPPPRSPTSSAGWWGRHWVCPGARCGSSSPTSAAALATSRTLCTSLCAPGSPPRWGDGWCIWSAAGRRPLSLTGSATPSAPTSSPTSGRTAPWWPGSLRPGPTRGPTPPTATASWPRAWAPSPSSTPATIWSATAGRSTPTAPPPAPCVVMGSPRPCGPGSATSTISVRLSGWSLWNSAGRI